MIVIFLLIPLSIIIAICFLLAFIWAVRSGQYEDTCTPALRLLLEEKRNQKSPAPPKTGRANQKSTPKTAEAKNE